MKTQRLIIIVAWICSLPALSWAQCGGGEDVWLEVNATSLWSVTAIPRYVGGTVIVYDWSITWSIAWCREYHDPPGLLNKYHYDVTQAASYTWNPGGEGGLQMTRTGTTTRNVFISSAVTATYNGRSDTDSEWTQVQCEASGGNQGSPIIIQPRPAPVTPRAGG